MLAVRELDWPRLLPDGDAAAPMAECLTGDCAFAADPVGRADAVWATSLPDVRVGLTRDPQRASVARAAGTM